MLDSIEILKTERDKLVRMTKILDDSIAALGGEVSGGKKRFVSAAKRRRLSIALKKSWAVRRKKAGKG